MKLRIMSLNRFGKLTGEVYDNNDKHLATITEQELRYDLDTHTYWVEYDGKIIKTKNHNR